MSTTRWISFAAIVALTILVVLYFMAAMAMGDCAPGLQCISEDTRRAIFFGSPLAGLTVVVITYRRLLKGKN